MSVTETSEVDEERWRYVMEVLRIAQDTDHEQELMWHFGRDGTEPIQFSLDCSDTFHWASADAEPIRPEDLPLLRSCVADLTKIYGSSFRVCHLDTLYAARKREMRPMQAWFRCFEQYQDDKAVFKLLMAAGSERTRESEG